MISDILERIERRESVRHSLPEGGVLSLDRGLPFLLVYRQPPAREDAGTERLVSGEAAFLVSGAEPQEELVSTVGNLAEAGADAYGAFLVLEIWSAVDPESRCFTIRAPEGPAPETVSRLEESLGSMEKLRPGIEVVAETSDVRHPPGLPPLLSIEESWRKEILLLGLEVPPIYRDPASGTLFPRFLRGFQHELSRALRRAIYEFVRVQTTCKVENHLALGTRTLPGTVWEIDRALCAIEHDFDMLLLTSPVNAASEWERFRESGYEKNPEFHYRLLPVDPDLMKRRLFSIPMETIDDPALADLFEDKREELDTQLSMLRDRGSARFRYGSQRLYGTVDDRLHTTARQLLSEVPPPRRRPNRGEPVDAAGFLEVAKKELAHYAERHPDLSTYAEIRRDLSGLMVSEGNLLIGEDLMLDPARVSALLHHEVGTHVLTFVNGSAQPLEQLSLGLAGYDELQEGLAVLAEYLVGGLNGRRMRLLAARVVAARTVEGGGEFVDTFRRLTRGHGYSARGAWRIAMRVHASGGFTRDFIYLRGLVSLLDLLRQGVELESLYLGKIARKHLPIIEELRHRGVLREPPLRPRFLDEPDTHDRLEAVRRGIPLTEMISPESA